MSKFAIGLARKDSGASRHMPVLRILQEKYSAPGRLTA